MSQNRVPAAAHLSPLGWVPSPQVKEEYTEFFRAADVRGEGSISGLTAVDFFKRSGLSQWDLQQVWAIADYNKRGALGIDEFCVACRLIAMAQAGKPVTTEALKQFAWVPLPPPRFQGLEYLAQGNTRTPEHLDKEAQRRRDSPWNMTEQTRAEYMQVYNMQPLNPQTGCITGSAVHVLLSQYGLDRQKLKLIWDMCDRGQKGELSAVEFCAAMHLTIGVAKRGYELPAKLPPEILPKELQSPVSGDGGFDTAAKNKADSMLAAIDAEEQARRRAIEEAEAKAKAEQQAKLEAERFAKQKAAAMEAAQIQAREVLQLHTSNVLLGKHESVTQSLKASLEVFNKARELQNLYINRLKDERANLQSAVHMLQGKLEHLKSEQQTRQGELSQLDASVRSIKLQLETN